ncbi:hypothetical protein JW905_05110 [bacterium]|nr:hypothetical protein [candidate division CSSED10-310 bacterium]
MKRRSDYQFLRRTAIILLLLNRAVALQAGSERERLGDYEELVEIERAAGSDQIERAIDLLKTFLGNRSELSTCERIIIHTRIAKLLATHGRYQEARRLFESLLRRSDLADQEWADIQYNIAKYQQYQGMITEAEERYRAILSKCGDTLPHQWGVYWAKLRLAAIAWRRGDRAAALTTYEELPADKAWRESLQRLPYELATVLLFVAEDLRCMGRPDKAAAVYAGIVAMEREWPPHEMDRLLIARLELGRSLWQCRDIHGALRAWHDLLDLDTYHIYAESVDYPAVLALLTPTERHTAGVDRFFTRFLAAIAPREAILNTSSRPRIDLLYPHPGLGLDGLHSRQDIADNLPGNHPSTPCASPCTR